MPASTVTFGEIMLRLTPPGFERLMQSPTLHATFGGGEANVAASLAGFGLPAAFVTILPQANPLADAAIGELRGFGVDTSQIARSAGRMGIYFLETGASQRGSRVVYDREGSAFALASATIDWPRVLAGAGWFHVTGITPAVSQAAANLAIEAARTARGMGITVSCDLNFRKNLWKWGKAAAEVMPGLVKLSDILIANEEDIQMALGIAADVDVHAGALDRASYRGLTEAVMRDYGHLQGHRRDASRVEKRVPQRLVGVFARRPRVPAEPDLRHRAHCRPGRRRRQLCRRADLRHANRPRIAGGARFCRGRQLPEAFDSRRFQSRQYG